MAMYVKQKGSKCTVGVVVFAPVVGIFLVTTDPTVVKDCDPDYG